MAPYGRGEQIKQASLEMEPPRESQLQSNPSFGAPHQSLQEAGSTAWSYDGPPLYRHQRFGVGVTTRSVRLENLAMARETRRRFRCKISLVVLWRSQRVETSGLP